MRALVVYESKYGNTEQIARAVGAAIGNGESVPVASYKEVTALPKDLELLIVGSPTQAHGVPVEFKLFLDDLPGSSLQGVAVAAFDTRYDLPALLTGSAAQGIAKRLRKKGAHLVVNPESFFIEHGEGPLAEGEIDRATTWARYLLREMKHAA